MILILFHPLSFCFVQIDTLWLALFLTHALSLFFSLHCLSPYLIRPLAVGYLLPAHSSSIDLCSLIACGDDGPPLIFEDDMYNAQFSTFLHFSISLSLYPSPNFLTNCLSFWIFQSPLSFSSFPSGPLTRSSALINCHLSVCRAVVLVPLYFISPAFRSSEHRALPTRTHGTLPTHNSPDSVSGRARLRSS